jgi:hypothetical protein
MLYFPTAAMPYAISIFYQPPSYINGVIFILINKNV